MQTKQNDIMTRAPTQAHLEDDKHINTHACIHFRECERMFVSCSPSVNWEKHFSRMMYDAVGIYQHRCCRRYRVVDDNDVSNGMQRVTRYVKGNKKQKKRQRKWNVTLVNHNYVFSPPTHTDETLCLHHSPL